MPHSLLAILLVATHQGKHQIVFAYPAHPAALPRTSRPSYGKSFAMPDRPVASHDEDDDEEGEERRGYGAPVPHPEDDTPEGQATPPTFGNNSWLIKDKRKDSHADLTHEYFGLEAEVLADALLPNHTKLYNQKFELVVNHLAFIGHPVLLDNMRKKQTESAKSPVSPMIGLGRPPRLFPNSHQLKMPTDQSMITIDSHITTTSSPVTAGDEASLGRSISIRGRQSTDEDRMARLDRFNLVLVVDTPPDKQLSRQLDIYYRDIVVKLTAAIKGEERRNNWLSHEAKRCRKVRSEFRPDQIDTMTNRLVATSPLCSALADVYEAVVANKVAQLSDLNGNLDMSLLLHDELLDEKPLEGYRDVGTVDDLDAAQRMFTGAIEAQKINGAPRLARWHALLPLIEPAEMLDELEPGLVSEFVSMLTPRLNMAEYEMLLDVDQTAIAQITHHLVYWRKVRIIGVLSLQSITTPRAAFDMRRLPELTRQWASLFPSLAPLPSVLAALSTPLPFRRAFPDVDRSTAFEALVWLLRNDVVVQLYIFARVVASPSVRRAAQRAASFNRSQPNTPGANSTDDPMGKTPDSQKVIAEGEDDQQDRASSVINEPSRPSQLERRWLEQIVLGRPPVEVDHFQRIIPYLNGHHHLDAIAMLTSLTRREIRHVLDVFSSDVVTFLSPCDV